MTGTAPFTRLLIANRGEIALRIQRACRALEIESVQVCSVADRDADYVARADRAICIGEAPPGRSYLRQGLIVQAALATGAQAIHPGYGFLSENGDFAEMVEQAGLVFVGPPSGLIRTMGDKIAAKRRMRELGIPCVPGSDDVVGDEDGDAVARLAEGVGYPLILKAAGGGGGRGMRILRAPGDLGPALAATREEAGRAFGDSRVYMERFLETPRHIEIQVIADGFGNAVWLGARDCSIQRRHQKVIEEAPAPGVPEALIAPLGARCAEACRRMGYRGAGTFEFLMQGEDLFFIEMNTRIQVEHPVTEMVTGLDLVREQIRVAQGHPLSFGQAEVRFAGHAIECRINAEDPRDHRPSTGTIRAWPQPGGPGIRFDSHVTPGYRVGPHYDSLLGKLIAHGATRAEAIARMRGALRQLRVEGVRTNVALHAALLARPEMQAGGLDIHFLERHLAELADV